MLSDSTNFTARILSLVKEKGPRNCGGPGGIKMLMKELKQALRGWYFIVCRGDTLRLNLPWRVPYVQKRIS